MIPLRRLIVVAAIVSTICTATLTRVLIDHRLAGGRMCFSVSTIEPDELRGLLQENHR